MRIRVSPLPGLILPGVILLGLAFLAPGPPTLRAADMDVTRTLKGIENRYNSIHTLEVNFTQVYTFRGRKRTESGTLYLRKPGHMRWQYTSPAGQLFVADGDFAYFYNPEENRAEKTKLKASEDLRAPLAFLLGKLDFQRDFKEFIAKPQGDDIVIDAVPKSDKLIYSAVSFVVSPDFTIKRLSVTGQDSSVNDYTFDAEKRNAAVADNLFRFVPPPGAEYVDSSREN